MYLSHVCDPVINPLTAQYVEASTATMVVPRWYYPMRIVTAPEYQIVILLDDQWSASLLPFNRHTSGQRSFKRGFHARQGTSSHAVPLDLVLLLGRLSCGVLLVFMLPL